MQRLPLELFDKIYDATFTTKGGERRLINTRVASVDVASQEYHRRMKLDIECSLFKAFAAVENCCLLWIDRSSRNKMMDSFYHQPSAVFVIGDPLTLLLMVVQYPREGIDKFSALRLEWPASGDRGLMALIDRRSPQARPKIIGGPKAEVRVY